MADGILGTFLNFIEFGGYLVIFVLMTLESANIPISSEIIMLFSGFLVYDGKFNLLLVVLSGALGNLLGSLINYFIGYRYGNTAIAFLSKFFLMNQRELSLANHLFHKLGIFSIFLTRLMPVVRTFISFPAGVFRVNLLEFSLLTFVGSAIWSGAIAYIGFLLGNDWVNLKPFFKQSDYLIVLVIVVFIAWRLRHRFKKS